MIIQEHEQQSSVQQNQQTSSPLQLDLSKYIPPPNPITTTKTFDKDQQLKLKNMRRRHFNRSQRLLNSQWISQQQLSLHNFYYRQILIFEKFHNKLKQRNGIKYSSSLFINNMDEYWDCTKYVGMLKQNQQIQFDSNYQSANLFQVYKTGDFQYDLILQNDLNTTGYAQWFNFKVKNIHKNVSIKLNIVNMYKSSSLYQKGMKPLTLSKLDIKADGKKWQRNSFQVQYYQNQIPTQRQNHKFYYTLSFCYQFKHDNDQVQFCHFFPYTSLDCQNFLSNINGSNKIKIKNIGNSSLKKPIPLIQIYSQSGNNIQKFKKAIVIIGRQHSGQTQSSFIIQQIVQSLLLNNNQSEFLLQKFDIYVCPMLNIDGVYLGNYRTNAYGYDLNRYWHTDNQLKIPEVFYFKKFIANLKKKNKISLILDLHGHSKKLNSFFYGNPYGKNYMMLPFVASKLCDMIRFKSCTFTEQKSQKSKTARAILGNLLKDSTYIYTYQVSFWGYRRNNRIVSYSQQNLKQLARTLVSAIYKVFMEQIKQENTLKQSAYFKQINKQLTSLNDNYFEKQSGSDSQAENLTLKQDFQKVAATNKPDKLNKNTKRQKTQMYGGLKQVGIQVNLYPGAQINLKSAQVLIHQVKQDQYEVIQNYIQKRQYELSARMAPLLNSKSYRATKSKQLFISRQAKKKQQQAFYHLAYYGHFQTKNNFYINTSQNSQLNNTSRKQFLLQKLRIFGENYVQNPVIQTKYKGRTTKSVGIQVPDLQESQKKLMFDSIISRNKSQRKGNYNENSFRNYFEKGTIQQTNYYNKWQNSKQVKRQFPRKKNHSMFLGKSPVEDLIGMNQKSLYKLQQQITTKKDKKQSFIKISKSPLVKVQKIPNLNAMMGNQIKSRQNIYDNISKLKSNITALRRQASDRLPQIQPYYKMDNY